MKYWLIMFPVGKPRNDHFAMKLVVDKDKAHVLLQDANATIYSVEYGNWVMVEKRQYVVGDTLHIVVDVKPKIS